MIDLNNLEEIRKLDPRDVYGSTGMFAGQCTQIIDEYWGKTGSVSGEVRNLVIAGMGGSAYGAHVVQSLFPDRLTTPLVPVSDYHLPAFVDGSTLVLLTSYSGSTEEVLSCRDEAKERGAKVAVLTAGGPLGELVRDGVPGIVFDPRLNPSTQPRLGTGYIITGTLVLLANLGLLPITRDELTAAVAAVGASQERIQQTALSMAPEFVGYIPVIFGAQHLAGNAHIIRNQFNETSKSFAAFEDIPELNHHLMEGLQYPEDKRLKALFIKSDIYEPKHARRVELTEDVVSQNGMPSVSYQAQGHDRLAQMLDVLAFGGYLTLYLGLLYGQDPSLVPWVDYFKAHLD